MQYQRDNFASALFRPRPFTICHFVRWPSSQNCRIDGNAWHSMPRQRSYLTLQNLIEIILFFFILSWRCAGRPSVGCRQLARHEHEITPKPHRLDPTVLRLPHNFRSGLCVSVLARVLLTHFYGGQTRLLCTTWLHTGLKRRQTV